MSGDAFLAFALIAFCLYLLFALLAAARGR